MNLKLRHLTQVIILMGIVLITFFNHYENQKVKYGGEAIIQESLALRGIDRAIGRLENRTSLMRFLQGDVWAAQIGEIKIADPLAFLGNISRTKKIHMPLFLAIVIPVLLTVIFGNIFCRWMCPMALMFELNMRLRKFLMRKGVPLFSFSIPSWFKYIVLGGGLLSGLLFGVHYFFIIYPPKLVSGEIFFWITRAAFSLGTITLFLILAVELILAPRVWCKSACPGGAVYTLLSQCKKRTQYLIRYLKLRIKYCVPMLLLLITTTTYAHHIRGLPHYGYSENYPQIPTYEETRVVDRWEIIFSFIKIFETRNCDLAVYIKNRNTGKPFNGIVTFQVFGEREDPQKAHSVNARLDPTNTFRVGWSYEKDGIYTLRIRFADGAQEYVEDFKMQMGEVGFQWLWLLLPGAVILILVVLIIVKRLKGG